MDVESSIEQHLREVGLTNGPSTVGMSGEKPTVNREGGNHLTPLLRSQNASRLAKQCNSGGRLNIPKR